MTSLNALTLEETISHRSDTILFFDVIYVYYNTFESNLFPVYVTEKIYVFLNPRRFAPRNDLFEEWRGQVFTGRGILGLRLGSRFVPVGAGVGLCREGTLASPSSWSCERLPPPPRATQASPPHIHTAPAPTKRNRLTARIKHTY
jgi:hypothetical protein